ncbi:MAG TPA: nucleotidyl transferase AbiEii/AbiGii toxin family protein [Solirubrobacterales bacterium]|nr:nucleotidyl transferase AbiEii/AbiGii toxin family protein [Solirubrobacterales bacterium]
MNASPIEIRPGDESAKKLWEAVAKLADHLGPRNWCLVGGLMVQLHAYEHAVSPRPTSDIDLLGDARARPSATEQIGKTIDELGGELVEPPSTDPNLGHRFEIDGQIVDVLAPDGLKMPPHTLGNQETTQIPGGTQALRRAESAEVSIDGGPPFRIPRPSLLGAILLKARALAVHSRPDDQREDLVLLLSLAPDPSALAAELRGNEAKWLREAEKRLRLDERVGRLPEPTVRRARQALRLLIPSSN